MAAIYAHVPDKSILPDRKENDLYPTPRPLIHSVLDQYRPDRASRILDIGAFDGRWGSIAKSYYAHSLLVGVELYPLPKPDDFDEWHAPVDFLKWRSSFSFDLIASNPPYGIAEAVVRRGFEMLAPDGTMIMLLSADFSHGVDRYNDLWLTHSPVIEAALPRRVKFYGDGTGGLNYSIYIWRKDEQGRNVGQPRTWKTELLLHENEQMPDDPLSFVDIELIPIPMVQLSLI